MKVLIIVPAYNEDESLQRVVKHLIDTCPKYDYVIVDDGSSDRTKEICEQNGFNAIHLPVNQGLTGAIQTGMQYALENGYDMALQFDADGQHLPEYIESMVQCMEETDCDIVIASRFYNTRMPLRMRTVGGKIISGAIKWTTGKYLTDPTSGMRLYKKNIIRMFADNSNLSPEPDTMAYLVRMGADVQEVQVKMEDRSAGKSYLTPVNAAKYMVRIISSILFFQWSWERKAVEKNSDTYDMTKEESIRQTA